jgi:hypothetical protein
MAAIARTQEGKVRRNAAGGGRLLGLLAAPVLALAAALAGLAFVLLLPLCGLASTLQGVAEWAWTLAKDLGRGRRHARATRT